MSGILNASRAALDITTNLTITLQGRTGRTQISTVFHPGALGRRVISPRSHSYLWVKEKEKTVFCPLSPAVSTEVTGIWFAKCLTSLSGQEKEYEL